MLDLDQIVDTAESLGWSVSCYYVYAQEFDIEDHVAMWLSASTNGVSGVPSPTKLIADAKDIQQMLDDLSTALNDDSAGESNLDYLRIAVEKLTNWCMVCDGSNIVLSENIFSNGILLYEISATEETLINEITSELENLKTNESTRSDLCAALVSGNDMTKNSNTNLHPVDPVTALNRLIESLELLCAVVGTVLKADQYMTARLSLQMDISLSPADLKRIIHGNSKEVLLQKFDSGAFQFSDKYHVLDTNLELDMPCGDQKKTTITVW